MVITYRKIHDLNTLLELVWNQHFTPEELFLNVLSCRFDSLRKLLPTMRNRPIIFALALHKRDCWELQAGHTGLDSPQILVHSCLCSIWICARYFFSGLADLLIRNQHLGHVWLHYSSQRSRSEGKVYNLAVNSVNSKHRQLINQGAPW